MSSLLSRLGLSENNIGTHGAEPFTAEGEKLVSTSPIDNSELGSVNCTTEAQYEQVVRQLQETFTEWRKVPAPQRGEIVRQIGNAFRDHKDALGELVSREMGKILPEGLGEVQEAIDIADFAVGLSRQLYGKTMHSERPSHRMYEQWHPLGIVGVISAFNFPSAVWAWNAMVAAVCGDVLLWKPSELTPLTGVAMNKIAQDVAKEHGFQGVFGLITDTGPNLGKKLAADRRIPLVSATGSCAMGRSVGEVVAKRLGKSLLELGGNNAIIIMDDADLNLVIPSVVFGAVGTAGQRCTSTRRLLVHKSICDDVVARLSHAYSQIPMGDPTKDGVLMGPLINKRAVDSYHAALEQVKQSGGEIVCGGESVVGMPSELYVKPTIVKISHDAPVVSEETFAPILYVVAVDSLEQAIELQNSVDQGLSSAIFTRDVQNAEMFLSAAGSDCGIANVNIGTSGAEIGGAFGGEKDTGGGRESGSDSWKQYMRRQTNTINYSDDLPLAQGISFELPST